MELLEVRVHGRSGVEHMSNTTLQHLKVDSNHPPPDSPQRATDGAGARVAARMKQAGCANSNLFSPYINDGKIAG